LNFENTEQKKILLKKFFCFQTASLGGSGLIMSYFILFVNNDNTAFFKGILDLLIDN